ncbi:Uncharacterised protein [Mycobacteroides abscessus subsp. abscessus]|nr:Uncharacterised protein [Mycobacteroides abscessus subsp. abscessus]
MTNRLHRFIGQRLTLITGDIDLNVSGLSIAALRRSGGKCVSPEILNVLHVRGVGAQVADHLVIEAVRIRSQRLLALEHDHHRTARFELLEHLADPFGRDHRGSVVGAHRYRPHVPDLLQLGHNGIEHDGDRDPAQHDGHCEHTDHPGKPRTGRMARSRECVGSWVVHGLAHAAFTRQ